MILALLGLGLLLLALPGVRRLPPDRLPLHEWVPIATVALGLGFLGVEGALVLIAFPTIVHGLGAAGIADSSHAVLAPLSTTPSALGWFSGLAATVIAVRFVVAATRARLRAEAARAEPWLGEHHAHGEFDLVVLPTAAPLAFGVPGAPPQVLVSEGLVETMPPDALEAIVRHETAHHRLRHGRFLALLAGADSALGFLAFVRRSTSTIRDAIEVWADDAAGRDPASRRSLRRALASLAGSHATVPDRSRRLERCPATVPAALRALWYARVALLGITAVVLALGWLVDGQHAFASTIGCT